MSFLQGDIFSFSPAAISLDTNKFDTTIISNMREPVTGTRYSYVQQQIDTRWPQNTVSFV